MVKSKRRKRKNRGGGGGVNSNSNNVINEKGEGERIIWEKKKMLIAKDFTTTTSTPPPAATINTFSTSSSSPSSIPQSKKHHHHNSSTNNNNKYDDDNDDDTLYPLPFPTTSLSPYLYPSNDFLRNESPYKESFQVALKTSYEGFVIDEKPVNNEDQVQNALDGLQNDKYFRTDVTQPFGLGTKCAKTYVTRCLLGEFGTTYKYLGLRMFAHPWQNHPTLFELKQSLSIQTKHHLQDLDKIRRRRNAPPTKGGYEYDVCLINRMEVSDHLKPVVMSSPSSGGDNRDGDIFGDDKTMAVMGNTNNTAQTSVSWHADSSLEHYSTIAVYQTIVPGPSSSPSAANSSSGDNKSNLDLTKQPNNNNNHNWYVAVRVAHNSEGPNASRRRDTDMEGSIVKETPPIAANLPSGSAYYMLDDFNHHHQHTVIVVTNNNNSNNKKKMHKKNKKQKRANGDNDNDDTSSPASPLAAAAATNISSSTTTVSAEATSSLSAGSPLAKEDAGIRYSCTYRLLRDSHNVNYVKARCKTACSQFHKKGPKIWRSEQLLLSELESEWIRQFYIQGKQHHQLLWSSWGEPIEQLLRYWSHLEGRTKQVIDFLRMAAEERCGQNRKTGDDNQNNNCGRRVQQQQQNPPPPSRSERKAKERRRKALISMEELLERTNTKHNDVAICVYDPIADLLEERAEMRELWTKRERDHVFHELPQDQRPMELPFIFGSALDSHQLKPKEEGGCWSTGVSPLEGSSKSLTEIANSIRALGRAYMSQNPNDLPATGVLFASTKSVNEEKKSQKLPAEGNHSKSCEWPGWGQNSNEFGIEMQQPWAGAVVDGRKSIETRSYDFPPALIGKRVHIIQSPAGKVGVSAMGDVVDLLKSHGAKVIGWCIFSGVKKYTTQHEFEQDESFHLVSKESGCGWKEGKTEVIYGWKVEKFERIGKPPGGGIANSNSYHTAVRRMRSLFQLKSTTTTSMSTEKRDQQGQTKKLKNKKRRRKRY